ncbi:MAG: ATP synthase F1 subunit epsilon [Planctomycetota bacterium]
MATETVSQKNLQLTVITPARAVLSTTANSVVAPAFDGEVGVMPGHAAMLSVLGTGELRVSGADGKVRSLVIRGGFIQVNHDKVTVLTPESVSAEEIKVDDLNAELVKLNELPRVKAEDFAAYENQKAWLKAKEKVATKK